MSAIPTEFIVPLVGFLLVSAERSLAQEETKEPAKQPQPARPAAKPKPSAEELEN